MIIWGVHCQGFSPTVCNRDGISARAVKGARACALTVFLHLSKLSHGNLRFAPGLKLTL